MSFKIGDYAVNKDGQVFKLEKEHQVFFVNAIGGSKIPRHATEEEIEQYHKDYGL